MKHFFLALTFLICVSSRAQDWGQVSGNHIFSFEAGYTNFRPFQLNDKLYALGLESRNTLSTFETFGIGNSSTLLISRGGSVDGEFALHYFNPIVVSTDSLRYKFGGWELMTSIYGFEVFPKVRAVDFVIAPGVFWGSIKMRKYFASGNPNQFEMFKNPFIAPMLRADLRFQLGPICAGGRWSYRYDISKARWKKGTSETLPGYKAREMQYIVYLGWVFNWKDK